MVYQLPAPLFLPKGHQIGHQDPAGSFLGRWFPVAGFRAHQADVAHAWWVLVFRALGDPSQLSARTLQNQHVMSPWWKG